MPVESSSKKVSFSDFFGVIVFSLSFLAITLLPITDCRLDEEAFPILCLSSMRHRI